MPKPKTRRPKVRRIEKIPSFKEYLAGAQKTLLPDHAKEIIVFNAGTGDYVLGATFGEAMDRFRKRWPDEGFFVCRVDGGPAIRMRTPFRVHSTDN
jgi:hypothetical protein